MSCCTQTNGLGQVDPATISAATDAIVQGIQAAKQMWDQLLSALGIGAGRREADVIVPLQNQIDTTVLAPVGDFLQRLRTGQIVGTCHDCTMWQTTLVNTEQKWLDYLHNTTWQDGRAAQQAEATLQPIFTSQKNELAACVAAKCGITGGIPIAITNPDGSFNWPIIAIGAGLVYAFMGKSRK